MENEHNTATTVGLFTEVAPKYEFLNSLMTAKRDQYWRDQLIHKSFHLLNRPAETVVDLASGTGDVARLLSKHSPKTKIIATDPTQAMLNEGMNRVKKDFAKFPYSKNIDWKLGLAEKLEFDDDSVDMFTIAFGFRNVRVDLRLKALQEAYRALKPGGVYAILELGMPSASVPKSIYKFLLKNAMPNFAGLFSPKEPYRYLAQSIQDFPNPIEVKKMMYDAGFLSFEPISLTAGMCWLYLAKKPE